MQRMLYACAGMCLLGWVVWQYGTAISSRGTPASSFANPEDGKVSNGSYTNKYFRLAYGLPPGWASGLAGPDPSQSGYYVLATLIPKSERDATILIAAQDMFFGTETDRNLADRARDFRQAMSNIEGMKIDSDLTQLKIADQLLYRVDYSGVGLFRATVTTEIRCHVVGFNLTTQDPELLKRLAHSLDHLSFAAARDAASSAPPCVKDYAVADNVLHKVKPVPVGPKFTPIPVRFIVATNGSVEHVHVIHATAEQRRSIEEALYQWKLKPYEINGHPSPVETGMIFRFTAGSTANSP